MSLWLWLIQSDNRQRRAGYKCEPEDLRGKKNKQRTNSKWRWPVPFRTNDLRAAFRREGGQLLGCASASSSSTGGRRMRGGQEKDREAGSHLLQRATTYPSSPRCLPCDSQAVGQGDRMGFVCLCLANVYAQLSLQYACDSLYSAFISA